MNILIVSGHPAQVHNFKYLKSELEVKNHKVFWLASDKDISIYLLNHYNIGHKMLIRPGSSTFSKIITLFKNTIHIIRFSRKNNIDISISRISPYVSLAFWLLRRPHIGITDTETALPYDKFFGKMISAVLTAKSYKQNLRKDQIRFDANIELFYLHPGRYKPDPGISALLGLRENVPYLIMRFVSWDAYHDKNLSGFTDENKIKAVTEFSKFVKVFITSEKQLPESLEPYRFKIPPEKMHDALAGAVLFFGESATMASESAVLGKPAIYLNENWLGYTDEEEHFGLLFSFKQHIQDQAKAISKGIELLKNPDLNTIMQQRNKQFLEDKIDVTSFIVWFIESWPESYTIMKENPEYQYKFK